MNYAVEVDKESPEVVAQAFLKKKGSPILPCWN